MGKRFCCALLIVLAFSLPASGSGFPDTYGFGVRAMALGGAFTAVGDDYSAAYYNPAALALREVNRFNLDFVYTSPKIEVKELTGQDLVVRLANGYVRTDPLSYRGGEDLDLKIPIIGLELDPNVILNLPVNVQAGVALSMPEEFNSMYRIYNYPPDQPGFFRFGNDISRITASISLGVEVVKDFFYIGGGISPMLYGDGRIYLDNLVADTDPANTYVIGQAKQSALLELAPLAGILITPLERRLKIGLSWRAQQEMEMDPIPTIVTVDLNGDGIQDDVGLSMLIGLYSYFTPEEYSLGIAYTFDRCLVSLEANRQLWGDYEYPDGEKYHYYPGNPDLSGIETGSPDFEDTLNLRIGIEYFLGERASIMAGYAHIPTPAPDQSYRVSNYLDTDREVFSLGARYTFELPGLYKPMTVGAVFQYQMLDEYTVYNQGVSGVTWVDQASYTVEGDVYAGGVSVGLEW